MNKKLSRFDLKNKKSWKNATISLSVMIILLIGFAIWQNINDPAVLPKNLCKEIKAIPAWTQDGSIIGYGVIDTSVPGFPNELKDLRIYLLYSNSCPACQLQIQNFGDYWEEYKDDGYAINCEK